MMKDTQGLPMFLSGIRQKVHDLPVLSICDATDETQILIPYGDGSDKQHAEAYEAAHLVLTAVNNHKKLLDALAELIPLAEPLNSTQDKATDRAIALLKTLKD